MAALLLSILTLMGCASKAPTVFTPPEPMPLSISVYPQAVTVYSTIRFKCFLPEHADGTAIYGIRDMFHSAHNPLDRRMYERLINVGCDKLVAYCGYKPSGSPDTKMISVEIEPVGECR